MSPILKKCPACYLSEFRRTCVSHLTLNLASGRRRSVKISIPAEGLIIGYNYAWLQSTEVSVLPQKQSRLWLGFPIKQMLRGCIKWSKQHLSRGVRSLAVLQRLCFVASQSPLLPPPMQSEHFALLNLYSFLEECLGSRGEMRDGAKEKGKRENGMGRKEKTNVL